MQYGCHMNSAEHIIKAAFCASKGADSTHGQSSCDDYKAFRADVLHLLRKWERDGKCTSTLWLGELEFGCQKEDGHAGAHSIIGDANGCDYFIRWRERGEDEPQNTW